MIGCLRTRVRKQPIIALYFESENELELYNLEARSMIRQICNIKPEDAATVLLTKLELEDFDLF